ncbi:MAG: stage 0 sporulation family protein [Clostridia bacterium]|nr:stage 0 sporulation family protein [Clostridia bacterium]
MSDNREEKIEERIGKNENPDEIFVNDSLPSEFEIIGVTFEGSGKVYYFAANGIKAQEGKYVIVETARGKEYGKVTISNSIVPRSSVVMPLKDVVRIATDEDKAHYEANKEKEAEAFAIGLEKIAEHKLDMKLIEVEYTFDNSKLLFYFTSDDRVDFRELVKDLAGVFRTRIELRQIGIRDEAKIMGGLGICGRAFCCHTFLPDFVQVSIKMAKEQNLSLNSAKISGACGRLMCCLRYEYDDYAEEIRKMPRIDSKVITPDGVGTVTEIRPLDSSVRVILDNDNDKNLHTYKRQELRPVSSDKEKPSGEKDK